MTGDREDGDLSAAADLWRDATSDDQRALALRELVRVALERARRVSHARPKDVVPGSTVLLVALARRAASPERLLARALALYDRDPQLGPGNRLWVLASIAASHEPARPRAMQAVQVASAAPGSLEAKDRALALGLLARGDAVRPDEADEAAALQRVAGGRDGPARFEAFLRALRSFADGGVDRLVQDEYGDGLLEWVPAIVRLGGPTAAALVGALW